MKKIIGKILLVVMMMSVWANAAYAASTEYEVPVKVVKAANKSEESMGAKAINPNMKVIEDNGNYKYIIETKELEARGLKGHLTNLIYKENGKREELDKKAGNGIYTNNFELNSKDKKNEITFAVWVDAMDELMGGGPGSGEQDVVFILDWNNAKSKTNAKVEDKKTTVANNNNLKLAINGKEINPDVKPYIKNGRTMVPVRFISTGLGLQISWDAKSQKVTINDGTNNAELVIGSNKIKKGNTEKTIDAAAEIKDGRTFVPVRAIAEIFDAKVSWDQNARTVSIEK